MFKNKKVIAIIPAKKNFKKLKNKNFLKINKFNLTELAILSSINNSIIDQTYVTTDSKKIIKIANKFKCKIIKRPKPLCKDSTNADEVIKHAISIISYQTDYYLVYLQPTSPFRNHRHIIEAFNILKKFKKNNLISVKENSENFYKSFDLKKYLKPNYEDKVNINRQKLKKTIFQMVQYIFLLKVDF